MKLHLINTARGLLVPESDLDYDNKKTLKIGETYVADIKLFRNADFHRKYFKMINVSWECLPEEVQMFFKNSEGFRKHVEITAGYYEPFFSPTLGQWVDGPKSIAFDKLEQKDFEILYTEVRRVIDSIVTRYVTPEEFEKNFMDF